MIEDEKVIIPEKETPKKKRATVKAIPVITDKIYLKGIEFIETIKFDNSDTHSHKIDCEVYKSILNIKGEEVIIKIKWNVSRANYQGLVTKEDRTTSLSFFPHFDHCRQAIIKFCERMI